MACRRERGADVSNRYGLVNVDVNREGVLPEREAAELASVAKFEPALPTPAPQNRRPLNVPKKFKHM